VAARPAVAEVAVVTMIRPVAAVFPARAAEIAVQEPLRLMESAPRRGRVVEGGAEAAAVGEQSCHGKAVVIYSGMIWHCWGGLVVAVKQPDSRKPQAARGDAGVGRGSLAKAGWNCGLLSRLRSFLI